MNVAQTILQQLGGSRFLAMTGARDLVSTEDSLSFRIPKANKVNRVTILLGDDDLYLVQFWSIRNLDARLIHESHFVFADNLRRTFTRYTGLETSLGTMGA